jgi:hypothetical protein
MKLELIASAIVLGALPGLILLQSSSGLATAFGTAIIGFALLMLFLSFTKSNISKIPWIIFAVSAIVLVFSTGYLARTISLSLGIEVGILDELSTSVLSVELSVIAARLFSTHKKYEFEFEKAGYDLEESTSELSRFSKLVLYISFGIAALSVGVFFLFAILPEIQIDIFTALILVTIIYFALARITLRARKKSDSEVQASS